VQRIEAGAKQRGFDLTQRGQDMTASTAQQGQRVTMRGQDMTAGTAAAGRAQSASQFATTQATGKWTYDSARGGQVNTQTGEFRPATQNGVPIGAVDKAPTEGERNAGGYAQRMVEATTLLDTFEKRGRSTYRTEAAGGTPFVGRSLQTAVMNEDQQQYRQAQEDWVRAKLRKESGASISPDEMSKEVFTYFPEAGDLPKNVEQKRKSREVANQAMLQSAGRGAPTVKPKNITVDW